MEYTSGPVVAVFDDRRNELLFKPERAFRERVRHLQEHHEGLFYVPTHASVFATLESKDSFVQFHESPPKAASLPSAGKGVASQLWAPLITLYEDAGSIQQLYANVQALRTTTGLASVMPLAEQFEHLQWNLGLRM
jgi:hypothetical protein